MNTELPKGLRLANNEAAQVIVDWARPRVPYKTGKARASLRASSTRTSARVSGGGKRVPWYAWLDFGGRVGPKRSVKRAFIKEGRYIYRGYAENVDEIHDILLAALVKVAEESGLDVTHE
jgi:hypothetical protein